MARPRPECARHPQSRVWFDGTYGRPGRRRQRFKCVPLTGEPAPRLHRAATAAQSLEDHECLECERPLAPHEGPPATTFFFEFTTRQIAEIAADRVGGGMDLIRLRRAGAAELAERTNGR